MSIDHIDEVNKNIDEIEHIEKFNPFHDARGRFSSSKGMASYSANPKTKAGQMAIDRSTAAGYGAVMNVHRESKGENIRQNDMWIKGGQKPNPSQLARAQANAPKTLAQARQNAHTNRVKGTMGATETAQARHPRATKKPTQAQATANQQQTAANTQSRQGASYAARAAAARNAARNAATQQTTPPTSSTQASPKGLKANVSDVTLQPRHKLGIQPRDGSKKTTQTKKVSNDHDQDRVEGKDISSKFDATKVSGNARAIDKVKEAQGWNKAATVTNDFETFQKAAVKSGRLMMRSVDGGNGMTAEKICQETMNNGKAALGGNGMKVYGGGMYLVGAQVNGVTGKMLGQNIAKSQGHSYAYGRTQMMATVHPNAKIATPKEADNFSFQFRNMSSSQRAKFGDDVGAFIASKGYDGAQWHNRTDPYVTMYNKSAMIFYGGVAKAY